MGITAAYEILFAAVGDDALCREALDTLCEHLPKDECIHDWVVIEERTGYTMSRCSKCWIPDKDRS